MFSNGYLGFKDQIEFLDKSFKQMNSELATKNEEILFLRAELEKKDDLIKKMSTEASHEKEEEEEDIALNKSDDGIELINRKKM